MSNCSNGATCVDGVDGFSCACAPGFTGEFCSIGKLQVPNVSFTKSFFVMTSHRFCVFSSDIDECATVDCSLRGNCIDAVNGFSCNCSAGFFGDICEFGKINRKIYQLCKESHEPFFNLYIFIRSSTIFALHFFISFFFF